MYEVAFTDDGMFDSRPIEIRDAEHSFRIFGPLSKSEAKELASHLIAACDFAECMAEAERGSITV